MAPPPVTRQRRRLEPVWSVARPPFPRLDPSPVARPEVLAPFTLTRLPVPTPVAPPNRRSSGAVGVLPWFRPVPRCPWPPASRQLGAPKRACPPVVAGKPATRCFEACLSARDPRQAGGSVLRSGAPPLAAPVARVSSLRSCGFSPRPESPPPRVPKPFSSSLALGRLVLSTPFGVRSPVRGDPPLVDLRALAFCSTYTSPVVP
jgi:hypothetical protein